MSFGFGVGDFLAVIKLANDLRKAFVGAPDQLKAISDEVRSLSIVLQDAEIVSSERQLSGKQQEHLKDILGGCRNVLSELDKAVKENHEVNSSGGNLDHRVKRAWKRLNWKNEEILEFRSRLTSNILLSNTFLGQLSSETAYETKRGVDELNQRQDDKDRRDILDWITPIDYTSEQHDTFNRRQPGTGQWLLDLQEYKTWVQQAGLILFCPGIPGAGKTILTSIVINSLSTEFRNDPGVGIAYTYCNFRRQDEQTVHHMLASLLRQLVEKQSSLPLSVSELFNQHKRTSARPSFEEILQCLRKVVKMYRRVFIIIDALDECSSTDGCRTRLLSEVFELQAGGNVNIFATSRPIPEITTEFVNSTSIDIRASDADVQVYLHGQISQLPKFVASSRDMQKEIVDEIVKAVNGMFLLAKLHLDSLRGKKSPKALRLALENLASGSDAYDYAYDEAMERIGRQLKDEGDLAKQALMWITCAKTPLTTGALQHALAVEVTETDLDMDNVSQVEDIVSVCAGLVTVDSESDIIRLVHYTTQSYFERTRSRWFANAETDMTITCLRYLAFDVFDCGPCITDEDYRDRLDAYQLYQYAACHWGDHAKNVEVTSGALDALAALDGEKLEAASQALMMRKLRSWGSVHYSQFYPRKMTRLHLVAYFGLDAWTSELAARGNPDTADSNGWTPLTLAAEHGHEAVASVLLDQGADINCPTGSEYRSPLSRAAFRGHERTVTLLLSRGANIEPLYDEDSGLEDWEGSALIRAASQGHETIVRLLLDHGAEIDAKNLVGKTALDMANLYDHQDIMRLLLDRGADPNPLRSTYVSEANFLVLREWAERPDNFYGTQMTEAQKKFYHSHVRDGSLIAWNFNLKEQ